MAAAISFVTGMYEDFELEKHSPDPKVKWIDGFSIMVAVLVVVFVSSINDYQKEKQFRALNAKHDDRMVKLVRLGKECLVSIFDVKVGDVGLLEPGDVIGVDGVLFEAYNLKCDESSTTGESHMVKKQAYSTDMSCKDCFILSGSKVSEGVGKFIVTNVGPNSFYGKTLLSLRVEQEDTPLQIKLDHLAESIARVGAAVALLLFVILLIKYLVTESKVGEWSTPKVVSSIISIVIQCVTIIVVAVPEGLPLAVTLALAYATRRMLKDNNLVRVLSSCEIMGNATTICSDKTGTLTQNKMTVVEGFLGTVSFEKNFFFSFKKDLNTSLPDKEGYLTPLDFKNILIDGIALNSSAFETEDSDGKKIFVGSTTEIALLNFCVELGMPSGGYHDVRKHFADRIAEVYPFSSQRKMMVTVVKLSKNGNLIYRIFCKGASEYVINHSNRCVKEDKQYFFVTNIEKKVLFSEVMAKYSEKALRTIALSYKDLTEEEYKDFHSKRKEKMVSVTQSSLHKDVMEYSNENVSDQDEDLSIALCCDMILIGIFGIQDPLRTTVCDSVKKCQLAGIFVRMVTGDNLPTGIELF